jgi:hypothetical protein
LEKKNGPVLGSKIYNILYLERCFTKPWGQRSGILISAPFTVYILSSSIRKNLTFTPIAFAANKCKARFKRKGFSEIKKNIKLVKKFLQRSGLNDLQRWSHSA